MCIFLEDISSQVLIFMLDILIKTAPVWYPIE